MTQSISPWTASNMKDANAQFESQVQRFLEDIIKDKSRHARFLNMLSMLEHKGSRRIMLSQMDQVLTQDTLQHLAEEARHAYFFKRQAERVAGHSLNGWTKDNTMCIEPSLMYFGRLGVGVENKVGRKSAYSWVSLVVELRACWFYEIYQDVLEHSNDHMSLKSILAEEDKHLSDMFAMCDGKYETLEKLSNYETKLFARLWPQLEQSSNQLKNAA